MIDKIFVVIFCLFAYSVNPIFANEPIFKIFVWGDLDKTIPIKDAIVFIPKLGSTGLRKTSDASGAVIITEKIEVGKRYFVRVHKDPEFGPSEFEIFIPPDGGYEDVVLEKIPSEDVVVYGYINNTENNYLDSVNVILRLGEIYQRTISNSSGFYRFHLKNISDHENDQLILHFHKEGYLNEPEKTYLKRTNKLEKNVILKEPNQKKNKLQKAGFFIRENPISSGNGVVGLTFLALGGGTFLKAKMIHDDYINFPMEEEFIRAHPEFISRAEGYDESERIRKKSKNLIIVGTIGVTAGVLFYKLIEQKKKDGGFSNVEFKLDEDCDYQVPFFGIAYQF